MYKLITKISYINVINISYYINYMKTMSKFVCVSFLILCCFVNLQFAVAVGDTNYDSFAACFANNSVPANEISKILFSRTNPSYKSVLEAYIRNQRFNTSSTLKPIIIVTPMNVIHIQATILCAKSLNLQLIIRSGGHDYDGLSYTSKFPFVILDMFNLRSIDIDIKNEVAWVQTGATLGELYYKIWEKSKVHGYPAGVCPTVGVGGHISGGGYGAMLRKYGLTVDNLVDAQFVDVNGKVLNRVSMGEDLFWAISGGGGASFGVIVAYKIKLVRVPEIVTVFRVEKTMAENASDIVYKWQQVAPKTDNDLFIRLLLAPNQQKDGKKDVRASFIALFLGNSTRLMSILTNQLPELGLKKEDCLEMSWVESVLWWSNFPKGSSMQVLLNRTMKKVSYVKRKSDYVLTPIPIDGMKSVFQKLLTLENTGLVFNPYGGVMSEIPENKTPFPHRFGVLYKIQHSVTWDENDPNKYLPEIKDLYNFMTPFVSKNPRQAFLNYRDVDIGVTSNGNNSYNEGKVYGLMYFKNNFDRLVKVKTMVDPQNFFRYEQSIPTSPKPK